MIVKYTIKHLTGKITAEVVDRQDSKCGDLLKTTMHMGRQISDEHTGPDCDRVEEINSGGNN